MIKSLVFYATKGLLPRLRRIVINLGFALSIVIGVTCFSQGPNLPVAQLKSSDVGSMILTYAAIAFGFCITGMALVLTLPNDRFLKSLQCHKIDSKSQSSYLVVSGIAIIIFRGTVPNLMSQSDALGWRLFVSWFFGLCAYSLIQFLMTVITLSQLGHLYSKDLDNDMPSSKQ